MKLNGLFIDQQTRCIHWHSELDIIAIKFNCCHTFYSCYKCHNELTDHTPIRYNSNSAEHTILCGVCNTTTTFNDYSTKLTCNHCHSKFNPGCKLHYDLYFENA